MDLFGAKAIDDEGVPQAAAHAPLAVRMRPRTLHEVVGQDHLLAGGSPLRRLLTPGPEKHGTTLPSVVLWGPPGTGKTTLAYIVAHSSGRKFIELSAVSSGVKEVRAVIEQARRDLVTSGEETVLFIDEVHRFSRSQQDSLLPSVENRWVTLIAATTENPSFSIISPLLSRSLLLTLNPLEPSDVMTVLQRALADKRGLAENFAAEDATLEALVRLGGADARRSLTLLEAAAGAAGAADRVTIDETDVEAAANSALVRYDEDQHYDVASAFIKSMRGSDVDAAIHYLARMIEAGEDPRFIARRIVIAAAEDVGMADPNALVIATSAAQAVALIGMPEARIILSQAVIAVASAPKSNAAYLAIDAALADIRAGKIGTVPTHLRDSHYPGAKAYGHGQGYKYAHDYPFHIVAQQYLPAELEGTRYYNPTENGSEARLSERLKRVRDMLTD